jgi:FlaA1/EpsC-like NDP-sugar epimerase
MIKNKKILIIGGTGALGKTLVNKYYNNNEIIVLSRDEHKHYFLKKDYPKINSMIGDVKDKSSIKNCLMRFKPEIVINTAALKHVPICEDDPFESVKTNIIGHQNLIESINEVGDVETLIFVSTDKACNPINVYGMCKAISEKIYVEYAKQRNIPKVVLVRYGNVLESTGSVIPFFKSLLENNSEYLPITHFEMTRFLLTLEQATDLIDWAYDFDGSHGKIAIPKIKSLKVTDVANELKKFYKKNVELKDIGIRPGEKLHEEMISAEEWLRTEEHKNFLIGNKNIRNERKSYNSYESLMNSSEAYDFLKDSGVIE